MKLFELIGINDGHVDDTFPNFILELAKKHNIPIKYGLQATVLLVPGKDYVYRIWVNDDGYETWLNYCETHQSRFLPKLLSRVRTLNVTFKRLPKDLKLKVLKLEKLEPVTGDFENALTVFNELVFRMRPAEIKKLTIDELIEHLKEVPNDTFTAPGENLESVIRKHADFFEYVLSNLFDKINDIASENNVMMRGDTPVLSDPISE